MILVRTIFHIRQGGVRQMVESMNTMVMEARYANLAAAEAWRAAFFASQEFQRGEDPMVEWLASGSSEYYTIEQE
jgi:hypothetical protein